MSGGTTNRRRLALWGGTALLTMAAHPVLAQDSAPVTASVSGLRETNRYPVRLMVATFDGTREYSHTQVAAIGRMRQGDESWVEVDFGNGAVHIEGEDRTRLGRFRNTSSVEQGFAYNYSTGLMTGDRAVSQFHNRYVQPLLGQGPELGRDATWTRQLSFGGLGFPTLRGSRFEIQFERHYFTHDGKRFAFVRYLIPSFTYSANGVPVVAWAEGAALTDETMGELYWNAALHRGVAQEGGTGRPYRYAKTIVALDAGGDPVLDPREIPQIAQFAERIYGAAATQVMPFSDTPPPAGVGNPLALFAKLDTLAISVAENSANQAGELTGAYTGAPTGVEEIEPYESARTGEAADELGAPAFATGDDVALPPEPESPLVPHEVMDVMQGSGPAQESAGGGGGAAEGAGGGGGGGGGTTAAEVNAAVINQYTTAAGNTATAVDKGLIMASAAVQVLDPQLQQIVGQLVDLQALGNALGDKLKNAEETLRVAERSLDLRAKITYDLSPEAEALRVARAKAFEDAMWIDEAIATAKAEGETVTQVMRDAWLNASQRLADAEDAYRLALADKRNLIPRLDPASTRYVVAVAEAAHQVEEVKAEIAGFGAAAAEMSDELQALPQGKFATFLKALEESPVGKGLTGLAHTLNALTIANGIVNTGTAVVTDQSSGSQTFTRDYSSGNNILIGLGLDVIGLAGNAVTLNAPGLFSDAAAITFGSVGDIIIGAKGLIDIERKMNELEAEQARLDAELARKQRLAYAALSDERRAEMWGDLAEAREELTDLQDGGLDEEFERTKTMAEQLLEERRRNREEAERQAEAERQRLVEEARAENERRYQEWLKRPPTPEEWAKFNADIAEAIKPDYPTAPPPTPEQIAARLRAAEARRLAELETLAAAAAAEAAAALAAAEAEAEKARQLALAQEEAVRKREEERLAREEWLEKARERELTLSELEVSEFDIEPVVFEPVEWDPPEWDPPVWEPPVWVPPEFDPPEASEIPWTDFGDDDWLPDTGNLAYGYEGMSGIVATDLSRWAEWLATQDVRKLERLALLAGYPNLASALADAANILALSQDDGYRRWAMNAPSCGGYVGCGPSYLERWHMKLAIVQLGDILAASRDIFSSGGFTDIRISTRDLSYLLRDHSLEDGDIVRIRIQQFGRVIYESEVNLTNAGQDFVQSLRPGVASLEIYAVNEGFSPPNTAQIRLEDVVQGESTQTYQLRTGETATLRIENNAN